MTDNSSDARLRATELQMCAPGLDREAPSDTSMAHTPNSTNGPHQRRHFARDGEVPVTVIHRHNGHNVASELDDAKRPLLTRTTVREEAERAWEKARNTIHDLETKLGHERLARDEATQRITPRSGGSRRHSLRRRRNFDRAYAARGQNAIRTSCNGGRQGARRNIGGPSLMQPPLRRPYHQQPAARSSPSTKCSAQTPTRRHQHRAKAVLPLRSTAEHRRNIRIRTLFMRRPEQHQPIVARQG